MVSTPHWNKNLDAENDPEPEHHGDLVDTVADVEALFQIGPSNMLINIRSD
jgi:hypothetical protein